ncbi:HTH-type transcriptional activator CmpR [Comamonadaceae bacterium OS-4]|nr:HTH-type transcriptional activator CmpR [Comamonadaceae bacterium OS-4]
MPTPLKRFLRITPQQLRAFEATSRLLSITQAAKELHVTQPTISVQLRELAEKVGHPLFETGATGMRLTAVGEMLVTTEAHIGVCWLNFETWLSSQNKDSRQRLSISAQTGAERFMPQLIRRYETVYPHVELQFAMGARDRMLHHIAAGECDLAVMDASPVEASFARSIFHTIPHVVIAPARHPLAGRSERIPLSALHDERWLLLDKSTHFQGFEPKKQMSFVSYEAIWRSVESGLGLALVPVEMLAKQALHEVSDDGLGVVQLDVEGAPWEQTWSLVWRSERPLTGAAKLFFEMAPI